MFTLEDLLEAASRDALAEHAKNVKDTSAEYAGDIDEIQAYYEEANWAKILAANGTSKEYSERDGDSWCGIFLASMFSNLNLQLDIEGEPEVGLNPKLAYFVMPSTIRLSDKFKWAEAGFTKPDFVAPKNIKFGDIVCVETNEGKREGDHITLALSAADKYGHFETIEGNGNGTLGDGTSGEGVVRNRRHVRVVKNVVRLERKHFIGVDHE